MTRNIFLLATLAALTAHAGDLDELRSLLRTNLPGTTEAQLDRAAAEGLVATFPNRVRWLTNTATPAPSAGPMISKAMVLEKNIGLIRVASVASGIGDALVAAERSLTASNKLAGLVLDLRFAGGTDLDAALASRLPGNLPKVVLVNAGTREAAVVLAATVRSGRALLVGARTAGEIGRWQTFTLTDGRKVQVTSAALKLADGTAIPAAGLEPDIRVAVPEAAEQVYFADAYATLSTTNTMQEPAKLGRRYSEADLVRAHREGLNEPDEDAPEESHAAEATPALHDPALARAVDLLKSLALVSAKKD